MPGWQFRLSGLTRKEFTMNWNIVDSSWKQLKGMVTSHWDKLDGIDMSAGNGKEVVGKNQETAEVAKQEIGEKTERVKDQPKE
jgi:uncharacterized protein YjbJ (UPF0337 family)